MTAPAAGINPDFEEVYSWLNRFGASSNMSPPVRMIAAQLVGAVVNGNNPAQAYQIAERLLNVAVSLDNDLEIAEATVSWSWAMVQLGNLQEASTRLRREALPRFAHHEHNRAVVLWLLGWIYWSLPNRRQDSIEPLMSSIRLFSRLALGFNVGTEGFRWYNTRIQQMNDAVQIAVLSM
jgi:hypothetical protein